MKGPSSPKKCYMWFTKAASGDAAAGEVEETLPASWPFSAGQGRVLGCKEKT